MPKFSSDIDLGKNEIKQAKFEEVTSFPTTPFVGQMVLYKESPLAPAFNHVWNGFEWVRGVLSIEGLQGAVTKADLDLDQVDNTSDLDKPISTAMQTALDDKQPLNANLTAIAATTEQQMLLANPDDLPKLRGSSEPTEVIRANHEGPHFLQHYPGVNGGWQLGGVNVTQVEGAVDFSGLSGAQEFDIIQIRNENWVYRSPGEYKLDLQLTKTDVGLSNVDNTSDLNKPISTATQTALNTKANNTTVTDHHNATTAHGKGPLATTMPVTIGAPGSSGAVGVSTSVARADHTHPFPSLSSLGVMRKHAEDIVPSLNKGQTYTITHNLNTLDIVANFFNISDRAASRIDYTAVTPNTMTITAGVYIAGNTLRVVVIG